MTWMSGRITCVIDRDTFEIAVERTGGPYASALQSRERIRMVNHEQSSLRPMATHHGWYTELIGKQLYCEVHSRGADQTVVVTARPM